MNRTLRCSVASWFLPIILFGTAFGAETPPTISHIANQVTQRNQATAPIPFTVGDAETSADSLFVTAVSRDTSMIPDENLALGGSGADRTITITPKLNITGVDTIIVSVSDGVLSASDTFQIKVNNPPTLDFNQPLEVSEGGSGTITSALLHAIDTDGPAAQITFTVNPDTQGQYALHGTILLNNVPVLSGQGFTQEDVDNNLVTYQHDGSESISDFFTFGVTDGDGGIASDGGFSLFHFSITIDPVNDPPTAHDSAYSIGIGSTLIGQLVGADPDSPSLTYSVTANGTLGNATITDSATGAFVYHANPGVAGVDSFFFQVYDGSLFAVTPGKITIVIQEQAPTAIDGNAVTLEGISFSDTLHATDPDLPPEVLRFSLVSDAQRGTVVITDSVAGTFTYTPQALGFGADSFAFKANDGFYDSPPAVFRIIIRANLDPGDILLLDSKAKALLLIDPSDGSQFVLASGDSLRDPRDAVVEGDGKIVVLDAATGLVRVDPLTGAQTMLTHGAVFTSGPLGPTSMALESDGRILVADGTAGIKRVDPVDGSVTTVSSGDSINLAVGVAVNADGSIIVGDASRFMGQQSRILRVNAITGEQHVISIGGNLYLPVGVALDDNGQIFVSDPASFAGGPQDYLTKVDPATGAQATIATSETLHIPVAVDITPEGKLIVSNNQAAVIYAVDSSSGATTVLTSGGYLQQPFGLAVVRPHPVFSVSKTTLDFGEVAVGTSAQESLFVSNFGSAPLYIAAATSDSAQFMVTPSNTVIGPSLSMKFIVTFTPTSPDTIHSRILFPVTGGSTPYVVEASGSGLVLGVGEHPGAVPGTFALYNNYPNPFNPATSLRFDVSKQSIVTIKIYSILGAEAGTIVNRRLYEPGTYIERFDASHLSSGVYFYVMTADAKDRSATIFRSVKKMLLVK